MKFLSSRREHQKQLRETFKQIEQIGTAATVQDADLLTGYIIGQIELKVKTGRLTHKQGDALEDMTFAINEEVRQQIEDDEKDSEEAADPESDLPEVEYFPQYAGAFRA